MTTWGWYNAYECRCKNEKPGQIHTVRLGTSTEDILSSNHRKDTDMVIINEEAARLIAAAPEMLAALHATLPAIRWAMTHQPGNLNQWQDCEARIITVINKVTNSRQSTVATSRGERPGSRK